MSSTGAQSESGDSRASNVGGGSRASQRSGTKISMSTSFATQLDPAEKDHLVRYKSGVSKRTGLSKNNCHARHDGAFLHFVTTSECAICLNFVDSCCKGCERAELKKNLDQNAATQEEFNASIQDFEVTFESTPKGTQLRKASDKVRLRQWLVLKEMSKTSTKHL